MSKSQFKLFTNLLTAIIDVIKSTDIHQKDQIITMLREIEIMVNLS